MPYRVTYSERAKSDHHNTERYIANPSTHRAQSLPPSARPPIESMATTANSRQLLLPGVDLQIDVVLVVRIKGTDVLHRALLAIALRPHLVVGVLRKLPEAIRAIVARNIAPDRERMAVLQIDRGALHPNVGFVNDLALHHARGLVLRQQLRGGQAKQHSRTQANNRDDAGKPAQRIEEVRETSHT